MSGIPGPRLECACRRLEWETNARTLYFKRRNPEQESTLQLEQGGMVRSPIEADRSGRLRGNPIPAARS
jgi:hypothetical protein